MNGGAKADGAYGADLASIHDAGFGELARGGARSLLSTLAKHRVPPGLVVDLGCGSGILAHELTRAGLPVLGVDLSPSMIALARDRAPRARFLVGSLHSVDLPACAAVTAIGECLSYCFDGDPTDRKIARLFRRIHRALRPGGVFLFDVAAPGRVPAGRPVRSHVEGDGWAVLVTLEEDVSQRLLTRRITSFRKSGSGYRRSTEVHRQRLFRRAEIRALLRTAGFEVRSLEGYGMFRFPRGHVGFLARKRLASTARRASSPPSRPRTSRHRPRGARPR